MIDNNAIIHSIENYMQKETPMAHYLIIADSSCELPEEYKNDPRFSLVPLYINIEDNKCGKEKNFYWFYFRY